MAYYYGDDPASQFNQSSANGLQARKVKSQQLLGKALSRRNPMFGTQEQPEREVMPETPEAPVTPEGTQRTIRPMFEAITKRSSGLRGRDIAIPEGGSMQDLFGPKQGVTKNNILGGSLGDPFQSSPLSGGGTKIDNDVVDNQVKNPPLDSSQWNTEGWGTPQYLGKAAGGPMAGWEQSNWDDQNMQTPKYVVGRILSNYPPDIQGLTSAMAEIQKAYPGATFDGKDKVTIPGLGTIDMLVNAGGENGSWAWQDLTNDPGVSGSNGSLQTALMGDNFLQDPLKNVLSGLDPDLLKDPQWRKRLQEVLGGLV